MFMKIIEKYLVNFHANRIDVARHTSVEVDCRCVEDGGRRLYHTVSMRNVFVVVAHAR